MVQFSKVPASLVKMRLAGQRNPAMAHFKGPVQFMPCCDKCHIAKKLLGSKNPCCYKRIFLIAFLRDSSVVDLIN